MLYACIVARLRSRFQPRIWVQIAGINPVIPPRPPSIPPIIPKTASSAPPASGTDRTAREQREQAIASQEHADRETKALRIGVVEKKYA